MACEGFTTSGQLSTTSVTPSPSVSTQFSAVEPWLGCSFVRAGSSEAAAEVAPSVPLLWKLVPSLTVWAVSAKWYEATRPGMLSATHVNSSAWICACVRATFQILTSSMSPVKRFESGHVPELPSFSSALPPPGAV